MENGQFSNNQDNAVNGSYQAPLEPAQPASTNPLQIIGLICGIAGIVLCCVWWLSVILGIAGIICAIVGNKQGKTGVGTAALVCSIIAIVLSIIIFVVALFGLAFLSIME